MSSIHPSELAAGYSARLDIDKWLDAAVVLHIISFANWQIILLQDHWQGSKGSLMGAVAAVGGLSGAVNAWFLWEEDSPFFPLFQGFRVAMIK